MARIGKNARLIVIKTVEFGVYLDADELGQVLLPRKYVPPGLEAGDAVDVFLYHDSEGRPVATTVKPKAVLGEFAYLAVVDTTPVGAFLDWGLDKDLLVPFSEQHRPLAVGQFCLVYLFLDKIHGRVTASSKIEKYLDDEEPHDFRAGQQVDLIIANSTDLGWKAIINHSHWGVLYKSDVFRRLSFGQRISGFIKHVRPDGKIDLSLQDAASARDRHVDALLAYLGRHGGFAPLHDKTDPQVIADLLGMSKGAFKKAVGKLYKARRLIIENEGIRLTDQDLT
ncbi:MAG TPA: S1-like domain-containing RNA-binding protein [Kineobactrum sp.]